MPIFKKPEVKGAKEPLNIIFFSFDGIGYPVADKLVKEGNNVVIGQVQSKKDILKDDDEKEEAKRRRLSLYEGILEVKTADEVLKQMSDIEEKDDWIVFFDFNHLWPLAEKVLEMGFTRGFFPLEEDAEFEEDRDKAKKFVEEYYPDLEVAEVQEFKSAQDGIYFLEETQDIWVLKGNGDSEEAKTIVPQTDDPEKAKILIIDALEAHGKDYEDRGFILERKIIGVKEITPEGVWYDGKLIFTDVDIENKPIGAGNNSVQTGCMQSLVVKTEPSDKINKMAFPPIIHEMASKRRGLFIWDAGMLYDQKDNKYYFSEFCFSSDTEVLTQDGWKSYQDIKVSDFVLSINPKTRELEWKPITRVVIKNHNGEMIKIKSLDALVTPDHHFWFDNGKIMKKFRANSLPHTNNWKLPRTGIWVGINQPEIIIPSEDIFVKERTVNKGVWSKNESEQKVGTHSGIRNYEVKLSKVKGFYRHTLPEITFKMEDFCYFLGLWIAEGSFGGYYKGEPRSLQIAQSPKNPKRKEMHERLEKMGLKFKVAKNGTFEINNRGLAKYLWETLGLKNTHADTKFLPKQFKELSPSYLLEIVMGYMIGDGHYNRSQWYCSTISKRLADDLQEIIHKIGWVANIKFKETKGTKFEINGKTYTRRHNSYILSTKHQKISTVTFSKNISKEHYNGIVWDVSVADNESLMVRRNGNAFFSSNCSQRFGWDSFFAELAMSGSTTDFFRAVFINQTNPLKMKFGVTTRGMNMHKDGKERRVLEGITMDWKDDENTWLYEVKKEDDKCVCTGGGWDLVVFTGADNDLLTASKIAHKTLEDFTFEDLYYRPEFDFLSLDYSSSILNRFNEFNGKIIGSKKLLSK